MHNEYFDFWEELKRWRSTSSGFAGYSEFLIFRYLYHMLKELGEKFEDIKTGKVGTDAVIFRSDNYEIANGATIHLNGKTRKPDIYIKDLRTEKYVAIIEIKILINSPAVVKDIVKRWREYQDTIPKAKKLLVIYHPSNSYETSRHLLEEFAVDHVVLKDNDTLLKDIIMEKVLGDLGN